jgi:hypothetical protein
MAITSLSTADYMAAKHLCRGQEFQRNRVKHDRNWDATRFPISQDDIEPFISVSQALFFDPENGMRVWEKGVPSPSSNVFTDFDSFCGGPIDAKSLRT